MEQYDWDFANSWGLQEVASALRLAVRASRTDTAARLRTAGAADDGTDIDRFIGACLRADRSAAERILASDPERGVRAERVEILRLATSALLWPDPGLQPQAAAELSERYWVEICGLDVVPRWVDANVLPQGAPPEAAAIDLDALVRSLGLRSPRSR